MTNALTAYWIAVLVTNWTGAFIGTNEVGIVVTNYEAVFIYEGKTNRDLLRSDPSSIAVFRAQPPVTNYWFHWPGTEWITNGSSTNIIQTMPLWFKDATNPYLLNEQQTK